MALSRGDAAAAALFYNKPDLISSMRRLIAKDPQMLPVYVTPDYAIYRWLPPPPKRRRAHARAVSAAGGASTAGGRSRNTIRPTR